MLKNIMVQTGREKQGSVDGLNLFFGALLGANLGTTAALPLYDYAFLIALLAFTVMTLRIFSLSERRGYATGLLAFYVVIVGAILYLPDAGPQGMEPDDIHRLSATLGVWVVCILAVEFFPMRPGENADPEADEGG